MTVSNKQFLDSFVAVGVGTVDGSPRLFLFALASFHTMDVSLFVRRSSYLGRAPDKITIIHL